MTRVLIAFFLSLCVAPLAIAASTEAVVQLKAEALVREKSYRLGDIANIHAPDEHVSRVLKDFVVGASPRPGAPKYLAKHQLERLLATRLLDIDADVIWSGVEKCLVRRSAMPFDLANPRREAKSALRYWIETQFEDLPQVELNITAITSASKSSVLVPEGAVSTHVRIQEGMRVRKRVRVWIDIAVDDEHHQTIPVWFAVKVTAGALVMTQPLQTKGIISRHNAAIETVDVTETSNPVGDQRYFLNWRVTENLMPGEVVSRDILEVPPAITEGERIMAYVKQGAIELGVSAIALEDGYLQERIAVANPASRETYYAVVTGQGLVRVD